VLIGALFYLNTLRVSYQTEVLRQASASSTVDATTTVDASSTIMPAGSTAITLVTVRLRDKPDTSGAVLNILEQGTSLVLVQKQGDWYKAQDPRGFIGWVSASPSVLTVKTGK
jgi:SH3-like domain-containing protein